MKAKQILKKVMVFGTFDILHPGHLNFFKQAARYGNYLIVVLARDKTVVKLKGRLPRHKEGLRLKKMEKNKLVDQAVLGSLDDKYQVIKKFQPQVICLGYDQKYFTDKLKNKLKQYKLKTKIIRLKPFKQFKYKTSILKNAAAKQ